MESPNAARAGLYRSETRRTSVEITSADGTLLRGDLHLQPTIMHTEGFETVLELLNRPEPFFAASLESGEAALISKAQTAVVTCDQETSHPDPDRLPAVSAALLDVHLASGAEYRGEAMWELPPSHCRSLDYLNESGRFFQITGETRTWYINRAHVRAVYPLD